MKKELNRIAKVIARSGLCSRRDAEKKIESGEVNVNGEIIYSPALNVSSSDIILVNGKQINQTLQTKLFIYNKPVGLITSHKDSFGRPTVFENISKEFGRLLSIGRLDLNSSGLLLLTNDGAFQRFMENPKNKFERIYKVRIYGDISKHNFDKLKYGIVIDGFRYNKIDVKINKVQGANTWIEVKLTEGKNREIRKVMQFLGYQVNKLIRISYAGINLDNLNIGEVKEIKIPSKIFSKFIKFES